MKRAILAAVLTIGACGCQNQHAQESSSSPPPANSTSPNPTAPAGPVTPAVNTGGDVIANIDDIAITRQQLEKPLFEGYGLNMLAKVAQRELAKREARKLGIVIGPDQLAAELQRYLATLFNEEKDPVLKRLNSDIDRAVAAKDTARADKLRQELAQERTRLLDQLLSQQKLSRADFDLFIETNSYLRAIAEAQVAKQPVTDEALHAAFNHLYGEKAQVLDIQVATLEEAREAQRRLASEPFEKVAREMSRDQQSAVLGGELPPFSRDTPGLPQAFKDVVFSLKLGQISDPVSAEGSYHIIMLKGLIPPNKLVKFEAVKDSVREFLVQRQIEGMVKEMRAQLQQQVLSNLKISEPILQEQFKTQTTQRTEELHDKADIRRELDRRLQEAKRAASQPTTMPTTKPATKPVP